jgi:hypothetical protein
MVQWTKKVVIMLPFSLQVNFEHFGNIFGKGLIAKLWNLR